MPDNFRIKVCAIGEPGFCVTKEIIDNRLMAEIERISIFSERNIEGEIPPGLAIHRLGSGIPAFLGRASVECRIKNYTEDKKLISSEIVNNDLLLILGFCGGSTSAAICATIAQMANEMNITAVCLVIQPFKFEGQRRQKNFAESLELVKELSALTLVCSLEKIVADKLGKLILLEAFAYADNKIAHCVTTLYNTLSQSQYMLNDHDKLAKVCQNAISENPIARAVAMEFV